MIPRLFDGPVVCIATGPSLTRDDCETASILPCVAVNDGYRFAPFASVLYACDSTWWDVHKGVPEFAGRKFTFSTAAAKKWNLEQVTVKSRPGFSTSPALIHGGGNSGFQAANLAYLMGATKIILLGYDMQGDGHFFGRHPRPLRNAPPTRQWIRHFDKVAAQGVVEIINCTRDTALKCFPLASLKETVSGSQDCYGPKRGTDNARAGQAASAY